MKIRKFIYGGLLLAGVICEGANASHSPRPLKMVFQISPDNIRLVTNSTGGKVSDAAFYSMLKEGGGIWDFTTSSSTSYRLSSVGTCINDNDEEDIYNLDNKCPSYTKALPSSPWDYSIVFRLEDSKPFYIKELVFAGTSKINIYGSNDNNVWTKLNDSLIVSGNFYNPKKDFYTYYKIGYLFNGNFSESRYLTNYKKISGGCNDSCCSLTVLADCYTTVNASGTLSNLKIIAVPSE